MSPRTATPDADATPATDADDQGREPVRDQDLLAWIPPIRRFLSGKCCPECGSDAVSMVYPIPFLGSCRGCLYIGRMSRFTSEE